ncbi:MAG: hypothetical protein OEV93_01960 [Candidatus Moranbacteria bacterium]|nr:hypothetical protein [Candidatus Moranbacteria bacterium]
MTDVDQKITTNNTGEIFGDFPIGQKLFWPVVDALHEMDSRAEFVILDSEWRCAFPLKVYRGFFRGVERTFRST